MNQKVNTEKNPQDSLGINGEVRVGERSYHIQTSFDAETRTIISSVFDGGRLITKYTETLASEAAPELVQSGLERYHREVSSEIEYWFSISEKVKIVRHALSHDRIGLLFYEKAFYEEAIEHFGRAIAEEENQPEYYLHLGDVYYAQQVYAKAVDHYRAGIAKGSDYADLYNRLGLTLARQGNYLDAIEQFREAVRLNKKYHEAYFNLGLVLLESTERDLRDSRLPTPSARLSEAAKRFRKAMQLSKEYNRELMKRGLRYIEEKDSTLAYRTFVEVGESMPLEPAHHYENEFYLKFLFGGEDEAKLVHGFIEQLQELIRQYPEFADLRNNLGIAYLLQGKNLLNRAMEEFRRALEINPNYSKAQKNLKLVENDGRGFLILLRALLK